MLRARPVCSRSRWLACLFDNLFADEACSLQIRLVSDGVRLTDQILWDPVNPFSSPEVCELRVDFIISLTAMVFARAGFRANDVR